MTPSGSGVSLDELAARYDLPNRAVDRLRNLGAMLADDPLAPTTIREPARIRDDHLADALVALELPPVRAATRIADLGAGAGIPGLPLAVALPDAAVWLVDSASRKCQFIERAIERLGLKNAHVIRARAESWADGRDRVDLVTARALAPLDVVAEYAAPLLEVGGTLVVWRGKREPQAERAGEIAANKLGLVAAEPVRVWPYPAAAHRYLHPMSKVLATPPGFPRRPGMARKHPLGAVAAASDRARR